jgi:hypothetical protein
VFTARYGLNVHNLSQCLVDRGIKKSTSEATVHEGSTEPQTTTPAAGQEEVAMHAAEQGMELRRTNVGSKILETDGCG